MAILVILLFTFFILIFLFSSPKLSPIPYFPSQKTDIPLIIESLDLKNNQTVFDLGAGDGIVIFEAAKKAQHNNLNTKFVAVEINPVLIFVLNLRRLFHPNKNNIKVVYGDIFKLNFKDFTNFIDFKDFITIYLYISPWYLNKTLVNIKKQLNKFKIVSYMYPLKNSSVKAEKIQGKNSVFIYDFQDI